MKSFLECISEKFSPNIDISTLTVKSALQYLDGVDFPHGDKDKILDDFEKHYRIAQDKISHGRYLRKEMPVISSRDMTKFYAYLKSHGIKAKVSKRKAITLMPLQKQIYLDNSIMKVAKNGVKRTIEYLTKKSELIISRDGYVMDGHHRFFSAILYNPQLHIRVIVVDLDAQELYPLMMNITKHIGNKLNEMGI